MRTAPCSTCPGEVRFGETDTLGYALERCDTCGVRRMPTFRNAPVDRRKGQRKALVAVGERKTRYPLVRAVCAGCGMVLRVRPYPGPRTCSPACRERVRRREKNRARKRLAAHRGRVSDDLNTAVRALQDGKVTVDCVLGAVTDYQRVRRVCVE